MSTGVVSATTSRRKLDRTVRAALLALQAELQRLYGADTPAIWLYGSHARGQANSASDVDVLLLYPGAVQPGQEIRRLGPILAELNLRYDVLVSVLPARREAYEKSAGPFWDNVRREGVELETL
jgi:uncharacterized protein